MSDILESKNEDDTLYSKNEFNDIRIVCKDGDLWYSKRSLYLKLEFFRVVFTDDKDLSGLDLSKYLKTSVLAALKNLDNKDFSIVFEQWDEVMEIANKWNYDKLICKIENMAIKSMPITLKNLETINTFKDKKVYAEALAQFIEDPELIGPDVKVPPTIFNDLMSKASTIIIMARNLFPNIKNQHLLSEEFNDRKKYYQFGQTVPRLNL